MLHVVLRLIEALQLFCIYSLTFSSITARSVSAFYVYENITNKREKNMGMPPDTKGSMPSDSLRAQVRQAILTFIQNINML